MDLLQEVRRIAFEVSKRKRLFSSLDIHFKAYEEKDKLPGLGFPYGGLHYSERVEDLIHLLLIRGELKISSEDMCKLKVAGKLIRTLKIYDQAVKLPDGGYMRPGDPNKKPFEFPRELDDVCDDFMNDCFKFTKEFSQIAKTNLPISEEEADRMAGKILIKCSECINWAQFMYIGIDEDEG